MKFLRFLRSLGRVAFFVLLASLGLVVAVGCAGVLVLCAGVAAVCLLVWFLWREVSR